ncbi:MAG: hypothetical protein A3J75_00325 [Acidobacteria bacterium RBG_16_68_9]|nr:MAG: hypothetical protein A3J75_00325 [Acidobacteria bacterium RBG_16_68_9]
MTKGYLQEVFVSFQGEGAYAGRRHLFIRMAGCNLRCRYCDTPDSLARGPHFRVYYGGRETHDAPNPVSCSGLTPHLARLMETQAPIDGVALTGGEPLLQAAFLAELLRRDELPRPRLLETGGTLPEELAVVIPWIDSISMDIKIPSNTGERPFWDEHTRFLRLARGKVHVKILVDAATLVAEVERAAELVRATASEAPVFLQPIGDPDGRLDVDQGILWTFYRASRRFVGDVRVLPQVHKTLGVR